MQDSFQTSFGIDTTIRNLRNVSCVPGTGAILRRVRWKTSPAKMKAGNRLRTSMTEVATIFGLAALIIFVGFLSTLLFERTRIPDVLILIAFGGLLGPALGVLDPAALRDITPLFGALALTLILFDGGLELRYEEVIRKFASVLLLIAVSFVLTTVVIAGVYAVVVPSAPAYEGLALGALLSAVSAPVVIPILSIMRVKSETKALLELESALTDAAAIIVFYALLSSFAPTASGSPNVVTGLLTTILFSTVIAVILGIAWLELLKIMKDRAYAYMITLAVVLGLFGIVETLGGTGPVAALVFGIVLSNGKQISRHLPVKTDFVLTDRIRWFHSEVTFFLKTFFFVSVGIIFSVDAITVPLVVTSLIILLVIVFARLIAVQIVAALRPEEKEDRDVLMIMMPRGLTSVVLASILVATSTSDVSFLVDVAFTVIILTLVVVTAGVFVAERRRLRAFVIPPHELEIAYWSRNIEDFIRGANESPDGPQVVPEKGR